MGLANRFDKTLSPTVSATSTVPSTQTTLTTTTSPYGTATTGSYVPTTTTNTLGQDYGQLLGQLQQYQANGPIWTNAPVKLPTRDYVKQRLIETEKLLDLLKEVDRILEVHPDLERLIGTLGRLGEL